MCIKNSFLFLFFFGVSSINLFGQKLTDRDLNEEQFSALLTLNKAIPEIDFEEKGVAGFYQYYENTRKIEIPCSDIEGETIDDISIFSTLPEVEEILFFGCSNNDFSSLKNSSKLKTLRIYEHKTLLDFTTVFQIKQLENLVINEVSNISENELQGIGFLKNLLTLSIENSDITDLSPIVDLDKLEKVSIASCNISKTENWNALAQLREVSLTGCGLTNLDFLTSHEKLEVLSVSQNKLQKLSLNFKGLKTLWVASNELTKVTGFGKSKDLGLINLGYNKLEDITELIDLENIEFLNISYNKISDICFLSSKQTLNNLDISNNPIGDASCLKALYTGL